MRILLSSFLILPASFCLAVGEVERQIDTQTGDVTGTWQVVSQRIAGNVDVPTGPSFYVFGDVKVRISDGIREQEVKYRINPSKDPKEMDQSVEIRGQSVTYKGIYRLEGDMLRICMPVEPSQPRPNTFPPEPSKESLIIVLKRTKDNPDALRDELNRNPSFIALKELGARFNLNTQGRIVVVMLSNTKAVDSDLEHLRTLVQLDSLSLAGTKITDKGLATIGTLTNLARLNLSFTQITDKGLAELKSLEKLQELELFGARVTSAGVLLLKDLPNLEELSLTLSPIGKADIKQIEDAMPRCKIVH